MDSVIIKGLQVSGLSYALIFVVLGVFYVLIKILLKVLPPKDNQK
ncbi:MAG: OadG-related small transporter subunit [Candidatus Cryosericum sp.]